MDEIAPASVTHIDVLIVGAGPAGLMAANWMSRYGITTRIIDKRDAKVPRGQADGLQSRTFEIFDSFGFGQQVWQEANHMLGMCLWNPGETGQLTRSSVVVDTIPGLSRFQQATLHQGHIEDFLLQSMHRHGSIEVERGVEPESLELSADERDASDSYPIKIRLRHHKSEEHSQPEERRPTTVNGLSSSNLMPDHVAHLQRQRSTTTMLETVKTKYVIACDGAHFWTRKQLNIEMQGEQTEHIWAVLDIIPITDFPDIRKRCAIHSAGSGSLMIIPRENKITRIYCQLSNADKGKSSDWRSITPDKILHRARQILAPYSLDYKHCHWYTAYQIGQRVASHFAYKHRIFLAGDAVHTHSPKAGQGMNVSMHDTYNLGWKIASVIKGICKPSILSTYEAERRPVALELIDFDHKFSRMFSGRPSKGANDKDGINMDDFRDAYEKGNSFTCGLSVHYGSSIITAGEDTEKDCMHASNAHTSPLGKSRLATNIITGKRFPSHQVLNQADGRPLHFQSTLESNGRWRIVVFAGNVAVPAQMDRVQKLGARLIPLIRRFTPACEPIDSYISVITIHSAPRFEVELLDFPPIMRPFREGLGWDYDKIFVDAPSYHHGHGKAYQNYGVDARSGCIVVVRPDQHVSLIGDLEDVDDVGKFFTEFMDA